MTYFNYLLVSIISFLGLAFGVILYFIAPEEFKNGKKHFKFLKHAIIGIIAILTIYFGRNSILVAIIIAAATVLLYVFFKKYSYAILAILLSIAYMHDWLALMGSLIFVYGLPEGTLLAQQIKKKSKVKIITKVMFSRSYYLLTLFLPLILLQF